MLTAVFICDSNEHNILLFLNDVSELNIRIRRIMGRDRDDLL